MHKNDSLARIFEQQNNGDHKSKDNLLPVANHQPTTRPSCPRGPWRWRSCLSAAVVCRTRRRIWTAWLFVCYACVSVHVCIFVSASISMCYNGQSTAAGARILMGHPHTTKTPIRTTGQHECRVLAYRGGRHAAEMAGRAFQVHLKWRSKGVRGCEQCSTRGVGVDCESKPS